jgi:hypothetical protein
MAGEKLGAVLNGPGWTIRFVPSLVCACGLVALATWCGKSRFG